MEISTAEKEVVNVISSAV